MNAVLKPRPKQPPAPAIPPGFWVGRDGRLTPVEMVKDYEKLKEETLKPIIERWVALHREMADLKAEISDYINDLIEICADEYGVQLGGKKGNASFYLYDGSYYLQRKLQDCTRFDERILGAEKLVRECLDDWTEQVGPEVKMLILAAFERNKEGDIRRSELIRLRAHKIDDERWQLAMKMITEAEQAMPSAVYYMVHRRDDEGRYRPVTLDFASIQPQRKLPGAAS